MDEKTFVYWLQGFVEIADSDTISEKQWLIIKDHLKLVFDKVTLVRPSDRNIEFKPNINFPSPDFKDAIGKDYVWPKDWKTTQIIC